MKKTLPDEKKVAEWAAKKEVIHTSIPIYLTLITLKIAPRWFSAFIIRTMSFFFFLFNKRGKEECKRFENQLIEYTGKKQKCQVFNHILSFAITFTQKIESWVKKEVPVKINFFKDDVEQLIAQLNSGKGAFVFCSHLGNSELFRNLANHNKIYVEKKIPVSVLMDLESTSNFTNTIEKINPGFSQNIVDINDINPGTIEVLQQTIDQGGMVVTAGDRISKNADSKYLTAPFLGKDAPWSYGMYLLAMLLKAPVYFIFGLREKDTSFNGNYDFHVFKSKIDVNCSRKERETKMQELCLEFAEQLEKHTLEHPLQWYNFYNFWAFPEEGRGL